MMGDIYDEVYYDEDWDDIIIYASIALGFPVLLSIASWVCKKKGWITTQEVDQNDEGYYDTGADQGHWNAGGESGWDG